MHPLLERGLSLRGQVYPRLYCGTRKGRRSGIFVRGWGRKWELSGDLRYVEPRGSVRAGRVDQI